MRTWTCEVCRKVFKRKPSKHPRFCSRACYHAWSRGCRDEPIWGRDLCPGCGEVRGEGPCHLCDAERRRRNGLDALTRQSLERGNVALDPEIRGMEGQGGKRNGGGR